MRMQNKPGLAELCASHEGRASRPFMKHMLDTSRESVSQHGILAGYLDFTRAALLEQVQKNHLCPKTSRLFIKKAEEASSLLRWVEGHPRMTFKGLKRRLEEKKARKPEELISLLSDFTSWRYSLGPKPAGGNAAEVMESVGFLSEEMQYVLYLTIKGRQFNMADRYNYDLLRILQPVHFAVAPPPEWKVGEWVSLTQLRRVLGVANAELEKLRRTGRLRLVATLVNPRGHIATPFFAREQAEFFAFPHKFGHAVPLDKEKVYAFREALIANSYEDWVEEDFQKALARFLKPRALAASGIDEKELLEASRKCIQCSEVGEAKPFIKQILPRLVSALVPLFGQKTPSALLLLSDVKKLPEDGRFSKKKNSSSTDPFDVRPLEKDERWDSILKEVEEYCRLAIPNKRKMVEHALQRFQYRKTGSDVYARKLTGKFFTGNDSGLVLITANLKTPFKVEIRMNGRRVEGYWESSLPEKSREKVLDGITILKHMRITLREFADAMYNRITYTRTRSLEGAEMEA